MFSSLSVDLSYRILTVIILFYCRVEPNDFDQRVTKVEAHQQPQGEGDGEPGPVSKARETKLAGDEIESRRRGDDGQPDWMRSAWVVVDSGPQQGEGAAEVEPSTASTDRHRAEAEVEAAVGDLVTAGAVEQPQPPAEDGIVGRQPRSEDHTRRPQPSKPRHESEDEPACSS